MIFNLNVILKQKNSPNFLPSLCTVYAINRDVDMWPVLKLPNCVLPVIVASPVNGSSSASSRRPWLTHRENDKGKVKIG